MKDASQIIDATDKRAEVYRCYHCGAHFLKDGGEVEDYYAWCASCQRIREASVALDEEWQTRWVLWLKGYRQKVERE